MPFVDAHLEVFTQTLVNAVPQGAVGMSPVAWAESVNYAAPAGVLRQEPLSRDQVRAYCQNAGNDVFDCFVTIMAWGGAALRLPNRLLAWNARDQWHDTIQNLRQPGLTRSEAYLSLRDLRADGRLPGLGPAFFTKLIFFMMQDQNGYIMDQWLGKSVNLLVVGEPIVLMDGHIASNRNTEENYEQFCRVIDCLAATFNMTPNAVEQALFSRGGRNPLCWRQYVRDQFNRR